MQTEEPAERHHASYLRAWAAYMLLVLVVWGPIKAALMWVGIEHWVEPHASPQRAWYGLTFLIALAGLPFSYLLFRWTVRRMIVEAPGAQRPLR